MGDDRITDAAVYSYAAPGPAGLTEQPLEPAAARWLPGPTGSLALLTYADVRRDPDPAAAVRAFLESAYLAGATTAGWDVEALARR